MDEIAMTLFAKADLKQTDSHVVAAISDTIVEEAVQRIIQVHRGATLQLALDVGAIVVEKLYGGDLSQLRTRGRKDHSLRKLASHPRLPFSAATLWRCVGVYGVVRRFPQAVRLEHLSLGHFRAVLGLPEARQRELLVQAAEEKRTVAWLMRKATLDRRLVTSRSGKSGNVVDSVRRVEESVRACAIPGQSAPGALGAEERAAILEHVKAVREWCEVVEGMLGVGDIRGLV